MAKLVLEIPDGNTCDNCTYRRRNKDAIAESYHCAIFDSRADSAKSSQCKKASEEHA